MTDFDGGASASADSAPASSSAPADSAPREQASPPPAPGQESSGGRAPTPLGSQAPVKDKPETPPQEPSKTPREALQRSFKNAREEARAAAEKEAAGDKPKTDERPRGEHGHFAAKEGDKPAADPKDAPKVAEQRVEARQTQQPQDQPAQPQTPGQQPQGQQPGQQQGFRDVPTRFNEAARAEWDKTPDAVKAEAHRAIQEMQQGIDRNRDAATRYEKLKPFAELAEKSGSNLETALQKYVGLDQLCATNLVQGLDYICQHRGFTLRQVAEKILGQSPDERAAASESETVALKQQITALTQQVQNLSESASTRAYQEEMARINEFAKGRPRFEELASEMDKLMKAGLAKDYADAYEKADRLFPSSSSAPLTPAPAQALRPPVESTPAQTRTVEPPNPAGSKSIHGAPGPGIEPDRGAPSKSPSEALERVFGRRQR